MGRRLRLHLSVDGLARTRLAHSPLWETVFSLRVLRDPGASSLHAPWALAARSRLDGIDHETLLSLWSPCAAAPDFLTPAPLSTGSPIDEELDRVLETPAEQVKRDLALTFEDSLPPGLETLYRKPSAGLERLVQLLHAYWERALADHWPRLRLVLEGDVVYRTRALAAGGTLAVFDDLHERVGWEHGDVVIGAGDPAADHLVDVDDQGLLLLPSAFVWPMVATMFRPPSAPVVVYPSRGIGTLWEVGEPSGPQALAALIGRTRAGLLAMLDAPLSTSDVAQRAGLSIGRLPPSRGAARGGARELPPARPRRRPRADGSRALAPRARRKRALRRSGLSSPAQGGSAPEGPSSNPASVLPMATILLVGVDLFFRGKLEGLLPGHVLVTKDSAHPPDLVVCDIARIDPMDVADNWPDIPILGYTNHTDTSGLRAGHVAGSTRSWSSRPSSSAPPSSSPS